MRILTASTTDFQSLRCYPGVSATFQTAPRPRAIRLSELHIYTARGDLFILMYERKHTKCSLITGEPELMQSILFMRRRLRESREANGVKLWREVSCDQLVIT